MINVRKLRIEDVTAFQNFIFELDRQSEYLLYDPGERGNNINCMRQYLEEIESEVKSKIFIAENEIGKIIAYICGETSNLSRISHVMKANIGVLKAYRGTNIARVLTQMLIDHAKGVGISRIEATVINCNKLSLNLCKKFGFEIEGIKKSSIKIAGILHDEYLLSVLIK